MKKSQRWTEKCFKLFLWLIALGFAWFLMQLGGRIIADLPKVEATLSLEQFIDQNAINAAKARRNMSYQELLKQQNTVQEFREKAELSSDLYYSGKTEFDNWLSTRRSIKSDSQDDQLIKRTNDLNALQQVKQRDEQDYKVEYRKYQEAQAQYDAVDRQVETKIAEIEDDASQVLVAAQNWQELKVFFYRLLLTLPLLIIAGWAYVKKRKTAYWPFVWGFVIFALFTFFVELVPYLPSYGGYVRITAGIILLVIVGVYVIRAFQDYLKRINSLEAQPEEQRRKKIAYDQALTFLQKERCPACERGVSLKDGKLDFCPHCGLHLFDHCNQCHSRKSSFALFCFSCGTSANNNEITGSTCTEAPN